jgi:hypothetical protein
MVLKHRTYRELINYLLLSCGDIDDEIKVKVVRRDENNIWREQAVVPISFIDAYDHICIEEKQLKWEPLL